MPECSVARLGFMGCSSLTKSGFLAVCPECVIPLTHSQAVWQCAHPPHHSGQRCQRGDYRHIMGSWVGEVRFLVGIRAITGGGEGNPQL